MIVLSIIAAAIVNLLPLIAIIIAYGGYWYYRKGRLIAGNKLIQVVMVLKWWIIMQAATSAVFLVNFLDQGQALDRARGYSYLTMAAAGLILRLIVHVVSQRWITIKMKGGHNET